MISIKSWWRNLHVKISKNIKTIIQSIRGLRNKNTTGKAIEIPMIEATNFSNNKKAYKMKNTEKFRERIKKDVNDISQLISSNTESTYNLTHKTYVTKSVQKLQNILEENNALSRYDNRLINAIPPILKNEPRRWFSRITLKPIETTYKEYEKHKLSSNKITFEEAQQMIEKRDEIIKKKDEEIQDLTWKVVDKIAAKNQPEEPKIGKYKYMSNEFLLEKIEEKDKTIKSLEEKIDSMQEKINNMQENMGQMQFQMLKVMEMINNRNDSKKIKEISVSDFSFINKNKTNLNVVLQPLEKPNAVNLNLN